VCQVDHVLPRPGLGIDANRVRVLSTMPVILCYIAVVVVVVVASLLSMSLLWSRRYVAWS